MTRLFSVCLVAALISACARQPPPPAATSAQALADYFVQSRAGGNAAQLDASARAGLLKELEMLKAAAARADATDPALAPQLEIARLELLANAAADKAGVFRPPSEAELQSAYAAAIASQPAVAYHIAHILVPTETAASLIITRLQSGQEFATLAQSASADESKARGGDLGWVAAGKLPAALTDAAASLQPGDYAQKPVHTPYGWHVVKLLETRAATAPPLDAVKAQLIANLQQRKYQTFLAGH